MAAAKKATAQTEPDETAVEQVEGDGSMGDSGGHVDPTVCVVDDGTAHVGRAGGVNGRVCSAHAVHYRSDGARRGE